MKKLFSIVFLLTCLTARAAMMANGFDWEAQRWAYNNIPAQGGTISASSYLTGTRFMQAVKWWGVRPLLGRTVLYLGNQTNAMLSPIIYDWSDSSITNDDLIAFVAADFSEATGLTGNATTKYLRPCKGTGLNLSSWTTVNSIHEAVYIRTGTNEASYAIGGTSGTANCGMPVSYLGSSYIEFHTGNDSATDTNGVGFYLATRTSTNSRALYKNGTNVIISSSTCAGALGSGAMAVHAVNSAGVITAFSSRSQSYYSFGYGVPVALVTPYRIAVRNVQVAKNRNVE